MQLLFYSPKTDHHIKKLEAAVHQVVPEDQTERFKKLDDFRERLRTIVEQDSVAILVAPNLRELQKMQLLRGLLTEIYVLLVIPDRERDTIALAHHLLPRFLSQMNSDFVNLKVVLNRMCANAQKSSDREFFREA